MSATQALQLKVPDRSDEQAVMDYRAEFLTHYPEHIPGAAALAGSRTYQEWLQSVQKDAANTDPARVIATQYIVLDTTGRVVGVIQLRHDLTPHLREVGGHIGYSVRPSEQGKGYATEMLRLCLDEAFKIGLTKILVTCDADNLSSARVIEKNGGVLEDIRTTTEGSKKRYWITAAK